MQRVAKNKASTASPSLQVSMDEAVIEKALHWLAEGHCLILVTVLKTWGSSPRPPGSLMVVRKDGLHYGSVSGGCIEADLVQRYQQDELSDTFPGLINYGVNRAEANRFGLPCGGRLELLVEKLESGVQLAQLLEAIQNQQLLARSVNLYSGDVTLRSAMADEEFNYTADNVTRVFGPSWQVLLIGAGQLSHYVAQFALTLGYQVMVCDPRDEYRQTWDLAGVELLNMMPDDAVVNYAGHPRSLVIALTHDPKLDDMALLDALISNAFYVGAIGSLKNCEARRQRLLELGLEKQQIDKLHAPVGLDIGSHTPPEIAVSIVAEITALRNSYQLLERQVVSVA